MQTSKQTLSNGQLFKAQKTPMKMVVTKAEIESSLKQWGQNLVTISKAYRSGADYESIARKLIHETYNYENGPVLFKPTLASKKVFRTSIDGALSYFIGGNDQFDEDRGFALNNWENVDFEIAGVILHENHGVVMGNKYLKDTSGKITTANFTMGFIRDPFGQLRIHLHHSSLPYLPV